MSAPNDSLNSSQQKAPSSQPPPSNPEPAPLSNYQPAPSEQKSQKKVSNWRSFDEEKEEDKFQNDLQQVKNVLTSTLGQGTSKEKELEPYHHDRLLHSVEVMDLVFHLPTKYKLTKLVGRGSYGVVCAGINLETNEKVAIKKVLKLFKEKVESKRLMREIRLLRFFNHDNIIKIRDLLNPVRLRHMDELYIVTELMDSDLQQIIHSDQLLTDDHIAYFIFQILGILKHMHSAGIVHRDLKPNNILINADCEIKLCDFGLARGGLKRKNFEQGASGQQQENDKPIVLTDYVTMRYYRAPELLLVNDYYSTAIDIWSVGCIMSELINRKPLFAAKQPHMQLSLIIQHLGKPTIQQMKHIKSEAAREAITEISDEVKGIPWKQIYPTASDEAIDLLSKLIRFDPDERITAEEALKHPYLKEYVDYAEDDYPDLEESLNQDYENSDLKVEDLKQMIFNEVKSFHEDIFGNEKLLEKYEEQYVYRKRSQKVNSRVYVTEQERKSYTESKNLSYRSSAEINLQSVHEKIQAVARKGSLHQSEKDHQGEDQAQKNLAKGLSAQPKPNQQFPEHLLWNSTQSEQMKSQEQM